MNAIAKLSLFFLLMLSACSPAATATTLPEAQNTVTEEFPTPVVEITEPPVPTATEVPIYPFYLPLSTKLDNVSQTINGVTTQIDWVYADESRVAIAYTISGLDWADGSTLDAMQPVQISIPALSSFRYDGFNGGGGANVGYAMNGVISASSDQFLVEGALEAEKYPNIKVNVDIPVEGPTKIGTFHFDFTVPVANGIRIENIDQTVEANQVAMTLRSLVWNPSHVDALLCFQMPSSSDWGLMTSVLTVNGKEYPATSGGLAQGPDGKLIGDLDTNRCNEIGFDILYEESATSLTLTVPRLQASVNEVVTEEVVDQANKRLADKGIEFNYENVDHGGNIVILKRPDGMTDPEIYPLIRDAMAEQYEGPWVFTVDLPK